MSWSSVSSSSCPKSPPGYPDLYGKRRQLAKVQVLEREIALLKEELKSLEGLQHASRCCKELDDFIEARPEPFMPINQKTIRSNYFPKRLWEKLNFILPWNFNGCYPYRERAICSACCPSNKGHGPGCRFLRKTSCQNSRLESFFFNCTKVKLCSSCAESCRNNPYCLWY